jgi:hypothetical protein
MIHLDATLDRATRLRELTREYSRFSGSAGGLSAVVGGLLCLASYAAGGMLPATPLLRAALIGTPILWLIWKQWMASRYYQRFGQVEELTTASERKLRLVFAGCTALVSLLVAAGTLHGLAPIGGEAWSLGAAGYMLTILLLPYIVWRWLRSPLDFAVGVFLLCQAALAFDGRSYPLWSSALVFPIASLILINLGIRDHKKFRVVEAEIRGIIESRRVDE